MSVFYSFELCRIDYLMSVFSWKFNLVLFGCVVVAFLGFLRRFVFEVSLLCFSFMYWLWFVFIQISYLVLNSYQL